MSYEKGCELRRQADKTGNAELYRQAAAAFAADDFYRAAAACTKKAIHYEKVNRENSHDRTN